MKPPHIRVHPTQGPRHVWEGYSPTCYHQSFPGRLPKGLLDVEGEALQHRDQQEAKAEGPETGTE